MPSRRLGANPTLRSKLIVDWGPPTPLKLANSAAEQVKARCRNWLTPPPQLAKNGPKDQSGGGYHVVMWAVTWY